MVETQLNMPHGVPQDQTGKFQQLGIGIDADIDT